MLMCLDVTYEFAAVHFLPVFTKIIRTCRRIDDDVNPATITPALTAAAPENSNPSTVAASQSKVSFVEQLKSRRDDKFDEAEILARGDNRVSQEPLESWFTGPQSRRQA
ncbi:unnamed protein product [Dibothriocephalus latus]|uniref:Uncharacterized protein n=1 Tax=Dibothriocephalus latus TaxID=60516 RepID=A0A3P7LSX5_DIBLA|nr:unnamed protein product [Dibothriocephalus latus]